VRSWRYGALEGEDDANKDVKPGQQRSTSSAWINSVFSVLLLGLAVSLAQLLLHDAKQHLSQLRSPIFSFPPLSSVPAPSSLNPVDSIDTCANPSTFPTVPPTSRPISNMALASETTNVVSQFEVSDADLNSNVAEFLKQMAEGLEQDGTSLSQIPTYVTGVPNGTEKGVYLAVDLGGTNFRVCSVTLNGDTTFNLTYDKVAVPKELMVAKTSSELFAFLAKQIESFLKKHHEDHYHSHLQRRATGSTPEGFRDEEIFHLGFTFSFPVQQLAINKGNLMRWTKGFDIDDTIGKDVCALLQDEIDKLHLPVRVAALVNDTVGTLMARSYTSTGKEGSVLGAIFGTGTNGAYIEKVANIKKEIAGQYDASTGEMVINTEWGSFDNQLNVLPSTPWDTTLDQQSNNPGFQMFEKRVSGMFLGEIVRLAVVDLIKDDKINLFKSAASDSTTSVGPQSDIFKQWGLDSAIMSVAAEDNSPDLTKLRGELEPLIHSYALSLEDVQAFKSIADAVGRRAARLSAVAIGAIAVQSGKIDDPNEKVIDIGVDGSLVEHYPHFRDMIYEALRGIDRVGIKGASKIRIGVAKDGSGVGAALIALVAAKMEKAGKPDLKSSVKKELDTIAPSDSELSVSNTALIAGGIVGVAAIGAFWWTRHQRA